MAAADACTVFTACCCDVTTIDADDTTRRSTISATDACAKAVAARIERPRACGFTLDGERIVLGNIDAGVVLVESLHGVCRSGCSCR